MVCNVPNQPSRSSCTSRPRAPPETLTQLLQLAAALISPDACSRRGRLRPAAGQSRRVSGARVVAFTATARPQRFFRTLRPPVDVQPTSVLRNTHPRARVRHSRARAFPPYLNVQLLHAQLTARPRSHTRRAGRWCRLAGAPSDAACAARSRCPTTRPCRPPPLRSCGARRQPSGPSSSRARRRQLAHAHSPLHSDCRASPCPVSLEVEMRGLSSRPRPPRCVCVTLTCPPPQLPQDAARLDEAELRGIEVLPLRLEWPDGAGEAIDAMIGGVVAPRGEPLENGRYAGG